jgi:hypothetical protein
MSRVRHLLLLLACSFGMAAFAQPGKDSLSNRRDDTDLDQIIEDAIIDTESDDQTDWTFLTDNLQDFRNKPINLNDATADQLLQLPGMNIIIANNLISYIEEFGKLTSIFELQAVPGFNADVFRKISPYVTVRESMDKDINPGVLHPAGPSFRTIFSEGKHEILARTVFTLEQERGYEPPDSNQDGTLKSHYAGNGTRYYGRYRMRYNQNFSMALVAEKDAGEKMDWEPKNNYYGFDYIAGHVSIRDFGRLKRLVVGDYNIQAGQGLLLSTGLGFGKGSEAVNATKRQNLGVMPFSSVNENQYLRGAAATYAFGNVYATGFFSKNRLDATVSGVDIADSVGNDIALISSLQTSGLHRTESELKGRDATHETMMGGRIEYKQRWLQLGATHYFQEFGSEINPTFADYKLYDFKGKSNFLSGVDFDITRRNFNFFGEVGRSKSGGIGVIGGLLGSLSPKVDIAILYRDFGKDFHSFRSYTFAERPTTTQNERGVYIGLKVAPNTKWLFSTYFDQFAFPWHKYGTSFPSRGHEFLSQLDYKPSRAMQYQLRFRSDSKESNASIFPDGQRLEYLIPTQRTSLRFQLSYKMGMNLSLKTRVEKAWYRKGNPGAEEIKSTGFIAYQDLIWKLGWKWKLTARYAVFQAEDYNARIYAYENDVLGFFSVPAYAGVGTRYYGIVQFQPTRDWDIWFRFARTHYYNDKNVGSSLSEIDGNRRTEIKVQLRYSF